MRIGFHVPTPGGWGATLRRALQRRCSTVQIFTSAPVQWAHKPFIPVEAKEFSRQLQANNIQPLFVHAIYLLNLATDNKELWDKSKENFARELQRASLLGAEGVVFHLGSVGDGGDVTKGLRRVAQALDEAFEQAGDVSAKAILENCAGQGNLVGCTATALGEVIAQSRYPQRLGVCIDTAHAFASGYAVHTKDGLDAMLAECEEAFGLERLRLFHANDSKAPFASGVDRHWHIGKGYIGLEGFENILNHPALRELPFIMETPSSEEWDPKNLRAMRKVIDPSIRPPLPPAWKEDK